MGSQGCALAGSRDVVPTIAIGKQKAEVSY